MPQPRNPAPNAVTLAEQVRLAVLIADELAVSDIACNSVHEQRDGHRWWDTRAMVDPREQSAPAIDMAAQMLAYAHLRGLVIAHPEHAHLLRAAPLKKR